MSFGLCKHCDCDEGCVIEELIAEARSKAMESCARLAEDYFDATPSEIAKAIREKIKGG